MANVKIEYDVRCIIWSPYEDSGNAIPTIVYPTKKMISSHYASVGAVKPRHNRTRSISVLFVRHGSGKIVEAVATVTFKEDFFPMACLGGCGKEAERRN
jgi:hypothetical protein